MRTYSAEFAPWRMVPLHENFVSRAMEHADVLRSSGPKSPAFETTCPYCGKAGDLEGVVRIGAKDQEEGVPMTREGYEESLPEVRDRDTEILIIHCGHEDCGAAIEPLAYLSPAVFWADREDINIWEGVPVT